MRAAVEALALWPRTRRRIFVSGDMYGLGARTVADHVELGREVARRGIELLVAIGAQAPHVVQGALQEGMHARQIAAFADRAEATAWLSTSLAEGDVLWAKGSRPMLLERLIEDLRAIGTTATTRRTAA
jgi:UDP-N-acetylmuramoyl-tripeptide--D-alanyl-D-alanine ligase